MLLGASRRVGGKQDHGGLLVGSHPGADKGPGALPNEDQIQGLAPDDRVKLGPGEIAPLALFGFLAGPGPVLCRVPTVPRRVDEDLGPGGWNRLIVAHTNNLGTQPPEPDCKLGISSRATDCHAKVHDWSAASRAPWPLATETIRRARDSLVCPALTAA